MNRSTQNIMLYDSTDPDSTPLVVDAVALRRFVGSYPVHAQRGVVADLLRGRITLEDLGPRGEDSAARLPTPDRVLSVREMGALLRSYPHPWTEHVARRLVSGEMSTTDRGPLKAEGESS